MAQDTASSGLRPIDPCVDQLFPVSEYIRNYGAYVDMWQFAGMRMNGNSMTVWDGRYSRNRDTAVGASRKQWWYSSVRGATNCRFVSADIDTLLRRCFKEVDYEKSLGELVSAKRSIAMADIPAATELVKFQKPFESFYMSVG